MKEKFCKGCKQTLLISQFSKSKNVKDGYENRCKKCRQEARKKHIKTCESCNKSFRTAKETTRFCSVECQGLARRNRVKKTCSHCNNEIEVIASKSNKHEHFYCNQDCRTEHLKVLMLGENNPNYEKNDYHCDGCNKLIKVIPSRIKEQKYIFCSNECYKYNIGNFFTGENNHNYNHQEYTCDCCGKKFKRVPSENRGEKVYCSKECHINVLKKAEIKEITKTNCDVCGKEIIRWKSKLKYTKNVYCSIGCKDKGFGLFYKGENSPRWNPELTNAERIRNRKTDDYRIWRKEVYERDNYTCQCCGDEKGGNLVAHHIFNYSEHKELRTVISNGITLCKECHQLFHVTYGYTNNNEQQLQHFLINFEKTPIP